MSEQELKDKVCDFIRERVEANLELRDSHQSYSNDARVFERVASALDNVLEFVFDLDIDTRPESSPAQESWISVEDRLPKWFDEVWLFMIDGSIVLCVFRDNGFVAVLDDDGITYKMSHCVKWQPVTKPTPPESVEDDVIKAGGYRSDEGVVVMPTADFKVGDKLYLTEDYGLTGVPKSNAQQAVESVDGTESEVDYIPPICIHCNGKGGYLDVYENNPAQTKWIPCIYCGTQPHTEGA